ncbi:MAG: ribbon-helix-helix domain-containing protein [Candidatus Pacebacteria bacterium]|nr:ribbon-helix-helix domain-containing protein [Candidatus Paceibacterota bacterium]NUQ57658.1 hypothetical protein [Candidatus Paceibacter sp.]
MKTAFKNFERINITLPNQTIKTIDRLAPKGRRSSLINEAVNFYVKKIGQTALRKKLQEGAMKRSRRDLDLAKDWFALENEVWQKSE